MIRHPLGILALLVSIEAAVLFLAGHARTKGFFKYLPAVFWIYFVPIIFSTCGVLPSQSRVYPAVTTFCLPASLVLILLAADLKAILRLGRPALFMMAVGSAGIMLGAPAVFFIFKRWLPDGSWSGFAALSASWTGGSANMIAVKEAIGTPDSVFLPMVVVDTIVAYSWMGILIALAVYQQAYDRWNRSDRRMIEELNGRARAAACPEFRGFKPVPVLIILLIALAGTVISTRLASLVPQIGGMTAYTWTILAASTLGILLSFTPAKRLECAGASKIGYLILYFVLTSIGARASLASIVSAPLLIVAGFVWVTIHGLFLFAASRLFKVPMALAAAASQANIGGPASAPIVAAIYEPALAPVGLLLGILGNVIGTYCGLVCAQLCRLV